MNRVYLDNAETTQPAPEVIMTEVLLNCFTETYGNPSSLHSFGQEAKNIVEASRRNIAGFINASPDELIFTGSGTESNETVLSGIAQALKGKGNHIIASAIEHHTLLEPLCFLEKQGFRVTCLPVDDTGLVDPDDLKKALSERTILVSVMHASHEIGTIQPIKELGTICREKGVYFHTDAVQSFGHIPIDVQAMNVDLLSASAHKLHGPKGVGLLYVREGVTFTPLLHGGDQEKRRRASTENTPGIAGFAKAVELAASEMEKEGHRQVRLRDRLITALLEAIPESRLNGHPEFRLPHNANLSFARVDAQDLLLTLDREGIAASTRRACSFVGLEPSPVLAACGRTQKPYSGSLRFSLGRTTTEEEIERVISVLPPVIANLRAR